MMKYDNISPPLEQEIAFSGNTGQHRKCLPAPLALLPWHSHVSLYCSSTATMPTCYLILTCSISPHWRLQPEVLAACSTLPECLFLEHRSQGTELPCLDPVHFQKEKNPSSQFPFPEGPPQPVSNQLLHHGILCKKVKNVQKLIQD